MRPESFLPVIADLAVSVAGFTAVIATLRVGQPGPWERHELIRTIGAVAICLVTIICAALPFSSGLLIIQLFWTICAAAITLVVTFAITVKKTTRSVAIRCPSLLKSEKETA